MYLAYWGEILVGFASVIPIPCGTLKYGYRQHRLVVLPDFQGLGIGTRLNQFLAELYLSKGYKYFIRTTHIRIGNHLSNRKDWIPTCKNRYKRSGNDINKDNPTKGDSRIAYSFEYVGENYNKPHQPIVCLGDCDKETATSYLEKIVLPNAYPIIITGNASVSNNTVWETIAVEKGWRTEVLFIKSKGKLAITKSQMRKDFDAIIIGRDNQKMIGEYKHAKDIRQLITFNYKYEEPKYYERLVKGES